jgi:hypothetical protein
MITAERKYDLLLVLSFAFLLCVILPSPQDLEADTFLGYECTDDCSGHEAGYEWAGDNGIDDEYYCSGNSVSFEEGCTAYVQEQEEEKNRRERSDPY